MAEASGDAKPQEGVMDAETRLPKGWAEAAASLLGPVGPRAQLTSAFSEALAARAGKAPPQLVIKGPVIIIS